MSSSVLIGVGMEGHRAFFQFFFCGPIRNHLVFVHPSDTLDCRPHHDLSGAMTEVKDGTDISNGSKLRMAPLIADEKRRPQLRPTLLWDFQDRDAGRLDVERQQEFEGDITGSQIGSGFDGETGKRGRKQSSHSYKGQQRKEADRGQKPIRSRD